MEYSGLLPKYVVNRRLSEQERSLQLKQGQRLNIEPLYQLSVISMNSTFLESVDKWFAWKGMLSIVTFGFLVIFGVGIGGAALDLFLQGIGAVYTENDQLETLLYGSGYLVMVAAVIYVLCWILRKESFAYTHYPIRFDRKARMVHVFRTNGSTLSVPWDNVFFTLGELKQWKEWEVRGHVLKEDGVTVEETFSLSYIGTFDAAASVFNPDRVAADDYLRAHWEFIRRFMEDGPDAVIGQVQFCMPISDKKETIGNGFERVCANIASAPALVYWMLWPFCMLTGIGRIFAMRTSKIPRFPEHVLAGSKVEPNDPYAIAGDALGERVAIYPDAAAAAGIRFIRQARSENASGL
jgi:hypothetical protein